MSLIFVDGFDFWTTAPGCWTSHTTTSGQVSISVSGSKLFINTTGASYAGWVRWTFPDDLGTVVVNLRAAFNTNTAFQDSSLFMLYDGNNIQCTVGTNSAGQFWIKRGDRNGTQVGSFSSAAVVMDEATYYDVECKINVANAGTAIIQLNGAEVLNVSGDLASTANEYSNNIVVGRTSGLIGQTIEHVVIMDTTGTSINDFIGPIKVNPHALTADGFYTDFTANVGDRWDAVNDLDPDGSATFITANTVGNKYTAVADNLPAGITDVYALAVWAKSQRSDDVSRAYKALLRYSGSDQLGSEDKYIGPNYAYQISTFDVSPFSATAWTPTEVDGLEVGVQITV